MELFDVHVLGFEVSEERATRALMRVFGLNEAASRIFVQSVPRIGKRRVPKDTAERYIRALHAVGAIVECRLSIPSGSDITSNASLPAPAVSSFPGTAVPHIMQDSFGVMAPVAYSPHMPQIPKAPRLPADLQAIRARKGPDSLAPHWRPAEGADRGAVSSPRAPNANASISLDGDLKSPNPDALAIPSGGRLPSPEITVQEGVSSASGSGGTAKAAEGAVFDSDGPLGSPRPSPAPAPPQSEAPWYAQPTHQLVLAAVVIGSVTLAASSGMFETDASRLGRAFEQAGIAPGQYDRADQFLAARDTALEGITKAEAKKVVEGLLAAGGVDAWLTGIERRGQVRTSHQLLVELPDEPEKRRKVFDAYSKLAKPQHRSGSDNGQRFLSLSF